MSIVGPNYLGRREQAWAAVLVLACWCGPAQAEQKPPAITWDWFKAAEIHRKTDEGRSANSLRLAVHYYGLAARKGNAAAAYKLGEMYENGWGTQRDLAKALEWYGASARAGNKHAEFRMGWFHHRGLGIPRNTTQARAWYELAANQDNEWAYHMLGFMYADGDGVQQNIPLARKFFEASLPRTDDHWAKWKLAILIENTDPKRARSLLREAGAAGNVEAQQKLKEIGR